MLERTDAIAKEVLEPITFVLAYPLYLVFICFYLLNNASERSFSKSSSVAIGHVSLQQPLY